MAPKKERAGSWPFWFKASLLFKPNTLGPRNFLPALKAANNFLWQALNIYDDFVDGEGEPILLPEANYAFRRCLEIYYQLKLPTEFYRLLSLSLKELEDCNRREVNQKKLMSADGEIIWPRSYPDFTNLEILSQKSFPLAFGSLAILYQLQKKDKKIEPKKALKLLRLMLAAKQLSDDARDWFEDLQDGHITAANLPIIKAAKAENRLSDLKNNRGAACLLFAHHASPEIITKLSGLLQAAKKESARAGLKPNSRFVREILGPIEIGLKESIRFRHYLDSNR